MSYLPTLRGANIKLKLTQKIKILFFSDTHLGFDYPLSGRSNTIRRGIDFFNNFYHILNVAKQKGVDLVIHGGDLFYRSKVPSRIIDKTYDALFDLADSGIPVVIVPGNHDRSTLPVSLFLQHKNLHVFREPVVFNFNLKGIPVQIAGFPYVKLIGEEIDSILSHLNKHLDWNAPAMLCMHQAFDGATVGPVNYRFRASRDVLSATDLEGPYMGYLSGHIHRYQVLPVLSRPHDRVVPFIYPGSIERTSFAERFEEKGYMFLEINSTGLLNMEFIELNSRPMHVLKIEKELYSKESLGELIAAEIKDLKSNAAILISSPTQVTSKWLSREFLRKYLPAEMHFQIRHRWLGNDQMP